MCPLPIINDIGPLSLTLQGVNACFIHHPSNVELAISQKLLKKKSASNLHTGQAQLI